MNKLHSRVFRICAVALLMAAASCIAAPTAAQAAPVGCAGPDAPPACHHLPPAPPVLLRTPSFVPSAELNYVRVSMTVDPSLVSGYVAGEIVPYKAYIDCSGGFGDSFYLTMSSDGHTLYSPLKGWWLATDETCWIDTAAPLHLTHSSLQRETVDSSPVQAWVASFS
jgi:hypothetical protein